MTDELKIVPSTDPIWEVVEIKNKQFDIQQNKTIKPKIITDLSKNDKHSIIGDFLLHKKYNHSCGKSYIKFCQRKNTKMFIAKIIHQTTYWCRTSSAEPDKEAYILNKMSALHGYYKINKPNGEHVLYLIQDEIKGKTIQDDWINTSYNLKQKLNEIEKVIKTIDNFHTLFNATHGDISGRNIIKQPDGSHKLIDFGCSKDIDKNQSRDNEAYDFLRIFNIIDETNFLPKDVYETLFSYVESQDISEAKDRLLNGLQEMKKMNL